MLCYYYKTPEKISYNGPEALTYGIFPFSFLMLFTAEAGVSRFHFDTPALFKTINRRSRQSRSKELFINFSYYYIIHSILSGTIQGC